MENSEENLGNEPVLSSKLNLSPKQKHIGTVFYIIIVIAFVITVAGTIYTFADIVAPTGKFEAFLELNLGYQIMIIAGFLAGLFFLLIFFFGLYKKGRKAILKLIFRKRELEEKYKSRLDVKLVAGGLLVSIIAIIVGISIGLFLDLLSRGQSEFSFIAILANFSGGQLILFVGILIFVVIGFKFTDIIIIRRLYYFFNNIINNTRFI
ncbi:MAG: hypothetical protein P8Y70_11740 [Candidatus Lokiarchaeota archaeon]